MPRPTPLYMMSKPLDNALHTSPLIEFLNALPSPLATTLVGLAPSIARARYLVQLLSWKAPWEDCWLALASWWAVCLIPELGLRYVLSHSVARDNLAWSGPLFLGMG